MEETDSLKFDYGEAFRVLRPVMDLWQEQNRGFEMSQDVYDAFVVLTREFATVVAE